MMNIQSGVTVAFMRHILKGKSIHVPDMCDIEYQIKRGSMTYEYFTTMQIVLQAHELGEWIDSLERGTMDEQQRRELNQIQDMTLPFKQMKLNEYLSGPYSLMIHIVDHNNKEFHFTC